MTATDEAPQLRVVSAPSAWRPADFAGSDTWTVELTESERSTLVALGMGEEQPEGLHELARQASGWTDRLTVGPGFLRLRGFPTTVLSGEQLEKAYLALGRLIGAPVGQDRQGSLITHIRDERLPPGPSVRRYQTSLSQDFHSDASDIVGLLCVKPAKSGGVSRIISAHTIYNELLDKAPEALEVLYQTMPWSRHTESRDGEVPYFELAPITEVDGVPRITVIPWFIRQSQAHSAAPRLTLEQLSALDRLEAVTADHALQISMEFESGDVQWLNNTTILHARDSYEDFDDMDLRRHLVRLWLASATPVADEVLRASAG